MNSAIWFILLMTLTLGLFTLPLLPALREWRERRDTAPLPILQEHAGDIQHFAQRFRTFIVGEIDALLARRPTAEPVENYSLCEKDGAFTPGRDESSARAAQRIIIAWGELTLPGNLIFTREIYGRRHIVGGNDSRFRAVLAEGDLFLGEKSVVLRWAHARVLHARANCRLQGRLSAEKAMVLGPGCTFTRLHAPQIGFGVDILPEPRNQLRVARGDTQPDGRLLVSGNIELPRNGVFRGDIVAHGDVLIHDGAVIEGNIKAHGVLRLGCNVTIGGSLVCGKHMSIAEGCILGGPLIAEQRIDLAAGVVVGTPAALTTITAPFIRIAHGVVTHGSVWAGKQGSVSPVAPPRAAAAAVMPMKSTAA